MSQAAESQIELYKKRLTDCIRDITALSPVVELVNQDPVHKHLLLAKLTSAEPSFKTFSTTWDKLQSLYISLGDSTTFPSDADYENRTSVFDAFHQAQAIKLKIEEKATRESARDLNTTLNESGIRSSKPSLPNISLPKFSGDMTSWVQFRDTFSSLVHLETSLNPVEKFHYLLSSLSGEAFSVVAQYKVTDINYNLAWKSLLQAYDNNRVLAYSYIDKILNYKISSNHATLYDLQGFLTCVADSISAFKALGLEEPDDVILTSLALRTLDSDTRHRFELSQLDKEIPTSNDLTKYIRNGCQALKMTNAQNPSQAQSRNTRRFKGQWDDHKFPRRSSPRFNNPAMHSCSRNASEEPSDPSNQRTQGFTNNRVKFSSCENQRPKSPRDRRESSSPPSIFKCPFCQAQHSLLRCFTFSELKPSERIDFVSQWKGCHNCLRDNHVTKECTSKLNCRYCGKKHHSLLHLPDTPFRCRKTQDGSYNSAAAAHFSSAPPQQSSHAASLSTFSAAGDQVLLGTARVLLRDSLGKFHTIRVLLDSGSTRSFILQSCVERFGLEHHKTQVDIVGIGQTTGVSVLGRTSCVLHSRYDLHSSIQVNALMIPRITTSLPVHPVPSQVINIFKELNLADPDFGEPQPIDMLLGADVWNHVVTGGPQVPPFSSSGLDMPYYTPTIFGQVITGSCPTFPTLSELYPSQESTLLTVSSDLVMQQLQRFWELEEPSSTTLSFSPDNEYCENHFVTTHQRDSSSGRYIVRIPLKNDFALGDNRQVAFKRFFSLENKFKKNTQLQEAYVNFMEEYKALNHMSLASSQSSYLIPHHAVFKDGKIRVVFDASCPSSTLSLNAQMLPGPALQRDISDILFRFRLNPIALVADLVKMYRQVRIHPEDRLVQHILWRANPEDELEEYELNTVTYGETSAAFLAMRCIVQLAEDEGAQFPLAAARILTDMFVDDLVSGAANLPEAQLLVQQLISLFQRGGFELGKWSSNCPNILPSGSLCDQARIQITTEDIPTVKVLGLVWDPAQDTYAYNLSAPSRIMTKRSVLSTIARIFDPLGFLAPIVFNAKLFLRRLWQLKLDWDATLPTPLQNNWLSFLEHWPVLSQVSVNRYVPIDSCSEYCIIGFCDASAQGYAASIYARLEMPSSTALIFLLKAKTKIAPVQFHSIARLELCGALLLSRLYSSLNLTKLSNRKPEVTYLMTDSTVVLGWLNSSTSMLKTFEANRVSMIRDLTSDVRWCHVRSAENPADLASRGLLPSEIIHNDLWWSGPSWLKHPMSLWPINKTFTSEQLLHAQISTPVHKPFYVTEPPWLLYYSSLQAVTRLAARFVRFSNKKAKKFDDTSYVHSSLIVNASEYNLGLLALIRIVQRIAYPKSVSEPKLQPLSPFLDERGIIRVGGRLQHAPLPQEARHPMVLPTSSHFTKLIVDDYHQRHFHSGATLTLCLLRNRFWIPSGTRYVKSRIRQCTICRRRKPQTSHPMMAPLPSERFSTGRPFIQVGVDYAGPFTIRDTLRRKPVLTKAYLCLFVCLATRAVHLEVVTSLTSEGFLATLDRFIARRGLPKTIHSDNGTNFVGASRYLKELYSFLSKQSDSISQSVAASGIEWRFIPPRAPHFGGLWEAGVKSVKNLLPNSVGSTPHTFEELYTIFSKIEALLNSRPICPLNESMDNYDVLTPGHFIIGSSLKALPQEDLTNAPENSLSRWQLVQNRVEHIWQRWSKEYLHNLNQRSKWTRKGTELKKGDLVILIEGKTPSGHWPLARIIDVHPGSDNIVRVVTLKNASGKTFRRAVSSLCPLPLPSSCPN